MRPRAVRAKRFQIVHRLPLSPTLLGQRLVRPSVRRRAQLAGIPYAITDAVAAFDFLAPKLAHSARRRVRTLKGSASPDARGPWIDGIRRMSSRVTVPVTIRPERPPLPSARTADRAALERLKDLDRLDAYANALASATCGELRLLPTDNTGGPYAPMDIIERYVDAVRKAQGKPTYAELDPSDVNFEAQLDDFVADVFRAMGATPRT